MDDKTFIASYVAQEAERINQRLKEAVAAEDRPTEEEKQSLIHDIEMTLSRMQRALMQIKLDGEDKLSA